MTEQIKIDIDTERQRLSSKTRAKAHQIHQYVSGILQNRLFGKRATSLDDRQLAERYGGFAKVPSQLWIRRRQR